MPKETPTSTIRPRNTTPVVLGAINQVQSHAVNKPGVIMHIREAQKAVWNNKIAKGFNTTDTALEFGFLTAEVSEAFTAWRQQLPDFGAELADIAIFTMALAEMHGLDLDTEIQRKIIENARRTYTPNPNGVLQRNE